MATFTEIYYEFEGEGITAYTTRTPCGIVFLNFNEMKNKLNYFEKF